MISAVREVTLSVSDLRAARDLYEGLLGMQVVAEWSLEGDVEAGAALARLWGLARAPQGRVVSLEQPGARAGAIRLVRFEPVSATCVGDGARPYDYGRVKNLDFFTDDVHAAHARLAASGVRFLASPVSYPVPWGGGIAATEAHTEPVDGVKLSLARLQGAPRKAFGEARHDRPFTEVAAVAQVVADYRRAERFYCEALGCVPAADTVVDDPGLVAALHLPPRTSLRLSFIGPPDAVGGKIGLLAYEGPGVQDARDLSPQARPPHRGAVAQSFEADDVDGRHALALLCGGPRSARLSTGACPPSALGGCRRSALRTAP